MQNEDMTIENEEQNVAEQNVTEQNVTEQNVTEQNVAEVVDEMDAETEGDEANESLTPEETILALEQQVTKAEQKAAESVDLLQRKAAEFQNSKRRQEKMVADQIERASTRVVTKMLPVLDDIDLAFRNLPEGLNADENAWLGGIQQIQKKLLTLLSDEGIEAVAIDGEFDPNKHEAVSSEPNDEVESGHIIETLRIGYEQKGRNLRPALVRVAM